MSRAAKDGQPHRAERLSFPVDTSTRALIERAAQLEGCTLAAYCVAAITEAAHRTIAEHEALHLYLCATGRYSSTRWSTRPSRASGCAGPSASTGAE